MLTFCALDQKLEIPIYELFVDLGYFWLHQGSRQLGSKSWDENAPAIRLILSTYPLNT